MDLKECDKCGVTDRPEKMNIAQILDREYDLCDNCYEKLENFMEDMGEGQSIDHTEKTTIKWYSYYPALHWDFGQPTWSSKDIDPGFYETPYDPFRTKTNEPFTITYGSDGEKPIDFTTYNTNPCGVEYKPPKIHVCNSNKDKPRPCCSS